MIKLSFSDFEFKTDGIASRGHITATIKYFIGHKWGEVGKKKFKTKVSYKPGDKYNLDKAYQIIKAKLEQNAYKWAANEAQKEINNINKEYRYLKDFIDKANNVTLHNHKYICDLLDIKL